MAKLGKLPAAAPALRLSNYIKKEQLPIAPADFGWDNTLPVDLGMLGNDEYGDCVWAGAAHEHMLWSISGKRSVSFTEDNVLNAYAAVTGFSPTDPNSDQGTQVQAAMEYRRTVGLLDSDGNRHKLAAYAALDAYGRSLDLNQVASAAWLFGAVGIGIAVPSYAFDQFQSGQPWDVENVSTQIQGGHYIPILGRRDGFWHVATWGRVQRVTSRFLTMFCDEAWAIVSTEQFSNGLNLDGLKEDEWLSDMECLPSPVITPESN